MASHFVGFARGVEGTKYSDFVTGTTTNAANTIEVRIDDAGGFRPVDVEKAMEMLQMFFSNPQLWATAGFVIQP
jgi:hypothetical protein